MAKKDKNQKVQKPVQGLQTDVAQITATGRVIAEHPSNFITPQKMRALLKMPSVAILRHSMNCLPTSRSATAILARI